MGVLEAGELAAAKRYMRVDDQEDDEMVTALVLAARGYLARAGVSLPAPECDRRAQYDLVCHAMALSGYDQRDPVITGTIVSENPQLRRMLTQLKLTEPVSKLDTGPVAGQT